MSYQASTAEETIQVLDTYALADEASKNMLAEGNAGAFGYISGGAEDEFTMHRNTASFNNYLISPRVLRDISVPDLKTSFLGFELDAPIIMPPIASHGLANVQGELATAKAYAKEGSIFTLSTYGSRSITEVASIEPQSPKFFQIYLSKIDQYNKNLIESADASGYKAIVITADSTLAGYREADIRNDFKFPLAMPNLAIATGENDGSASNKTGDEKEVGTGHGVADVLASAKQDISVRDIESIRSYTDLPIIIKGIQHPGDAITAIAHGADGIWVSNHGGRQLDGGPGSFEILQSVAKAVNKQVPLIFDSGVRRGEHIFKAIAHGADIVGIGRPSIYGLNLGGSGGVASVIAHFKKELTITMQLGGAKDVEAIKTTELLRELDL